MFYPKGADLPLRSNEEPVASRFTAGLQEVLGLLEEKIEDLYGKEDSDEYPGRGDIYNSGITDCLKIVRQLLV